MDGSTLQRKILTGYGKAARHMGQLCTLYRSESMINPISDLNQIGINFRAAFSSTAKEIQFGRYNKPNIPDLTMTADARDSLIGDWIVSEEGDIWYIADMQALLHIPVIQCNRTISITRPSTSVVNGALEPTSTPIASALPCFVMTKRTPNSMPLSGGLPTSSTSQPQTPSWTFWANSHTVGAIRKHDVITDELGKGYEVDAADLTFFGFELTAHEQKP